MFEVFQKYLSVQTSLTEEDYALIKSVGVIKKLRKRQYLLQEGDVWHYNAFVCKGCLRTYRVDDNGVEHILSFAVENWWAGDRESLISGKPAKSNIEALEDSVVLLFTNENFEMLKSKIPAFKDFLSNILERSFIASQDRIHCAISLNAEEKYTAFVQNNPQFVNRVPQHMIASYIGVSAETISRIRKQPDKK